jgi:acylphosphatase
MPGVENARAAAADATAAGRTAGAAIATARLMHGSCQAVRVANTPEERTVRRRLVVRGRVQGVWFRESARRRAEELGVAGWVRNTPEGTVEAELEGDAEGVAALVSWFSDGPSQARVDRIEVEERAPMGERGFDVR